MSNYDLLSKEESTEAMTHGWILSNVYDSQKNRWLVVILPVVLGQAPLFNAAAAASYVIALAKQEHALSMKALKLVMAGPAVKPKPKGTK